MVEQGGFRVTTRGRAMYREARRLFRQSGGGTPPVITQGGLGSIEASGHTHDREAMDWATGAFTREQWQLWELCTWIVGFASWRREALPGVWPPHTHGLPKGGDLSGAAKGQVQAFKNARDGLWSARYPRITALGVADRTWRDYRRGFGVSLPALQQAFDQRAKHDDVLDLQWALSRHLGIDVDRRRRSRAGDQEGAGQDRPADRGDADPARPGGAGAMTTFDASPKILAGAGRRGRRRPPRSPPSASAIGAGWSARGGWSPSVAMRRRSPLASLVAGYLRVDPRRVATPIGDGLYEVPVELDHAAVQT